MFLFIFSNFCGHSINYFLLFGLFETEHKITKINNNKTILILLILIMFLFGTYMYGFNRCEKSNYILSNVPHIIEKIISIK